MYAIIKDSIQVYTFNEKPKFQRGVLAYPLKAFDIIEGAVEVIEFEDTAKHEPTTSLKEVFRDGIVNGLQVWNERDMFATVEEEAEYLAKLQDDAIKAKIADGERQLNQMITDALNLFNETYGTIFNSFNDMSIYMLDDTYTLQNECRTWALWATNTWKTARANQASVLAGTMTEEEFIISLPALPTI